MRMSYRELSRIQHGREKHVCVGLDLDTDKIPGIKGLKREIAKTTLAYAKKCVNETKDIAGAYKINWAFILAEGPEQFSILREIIVYINAIAPECPVILDAKLADIGNTNKKYAIAVFDTLGADAVTVHTYHGDIAMSEFLNYKDKCIIAVIRTSNEGSEVNQDRLAIIEEFEAEQWGLTTSDPIPLHQIHAHQLRYNWNNNDNCGAVFGATYPDQLKEGVQTLGKKISLLIPGIGKQGGNLEATIGALRSAEHTNFFINSSRGIIFSDNSKEAADKLHRAIVRLMYDQR